MATSLGTNAVVVTRVHCIAAAGPFRLFFLFSMKCCFELPFTVINPVSILYQSIAGRYRPVRVADGPITSRYRFIKNASWESLTRKSYVAWLCPFLDIFLLLGRLLKI